MAEKSAGETVVATPASERALVGVGFPLLGALAGWGLKLLAEWIAGLSRGPFRGPFRLVASIDEPYATIGSLVIGLVAGSLLALAAWQERLTVTVSDRLAALERGDGFRVDVPRSAVTAVFLDGKRLVLLGTSGDELGREATDLSAAKLRATFTRHGYPWTDADPYRDQYRLWVEDMPGLPPAANALLRARKRALEKTESDDAAEMRKELLRLGVVVRDEKRRQYWRLVTSRRELGSDG